MAATMRENNTHLQSAIEREAEEKKVRVAALGEKGDQGVRAGAGRPAHPVQTLSRPRPLRPVESKAATWRRELIARVRRQGLGFREPAFRFRDYFLKIALNYFQFFPFST